MQTALITPARLAGIPNPRILDATFTLPGESPNAAALFAAAHIPGAQFFDIKLISDHSSPYPNMLPTPEAFAGAVGNMGISTMDTVVVYDRAFLGAARAWWMFRIFGHDDVLVLDGGLPKWQAEGRAVTAETTTLPPALFQSTFRPGLLANLQQMQEFSHTNTSQIVDVRSPARFTGEEPEPRPGMKSGHIPGSRNLHYKRFFASDGALLPRPALAALFAGAGLDPAQPLVTTCGSGVSAPIAALAAFELGHTNVPVYDGSWSEWGMQD